MSKERLLMVGAGGLGRVTSEWATRSYDCAFVDDGYEIGSIICGIPIVGRVPDLMELRKDYPNLIVTIGDNVIRERIHKQAAELGFSFQNIVCTSAYISPFAKVGRGCILLNNSIIQSGSEVGNGVLLNSGVEIHHDSFVDDFTLIYTNSVVRTQARIGKRVRIGSNVTVSNYVTVPDDSDIKNGDTLF